MKIDSKELVDFIDKVTLKETIGGGTIFITKNKIYSCLKNGSAIMTIGELKIKGTEEFNLHIKDTKFLSKVLNNFEGIIEINISENKLLIFNKTGEAEITLADSKFIENWNEEGLPNTLSWDKSIKISSDIFIKASENYKLIGEGTVFLRIKNKILSLSVGEDQFDHLLVKTPVNIKEEISCEFGKIFFDIFNPQVLEGNFELFLRKSDYPIKIVKNTEKTNFTFLIAPMVEGENEEENKIEETENENVEKEE